MASTYTNSGFELIGDDEQFEQWGYTENTNKELVDEAINGVISLELTGTAHTLTTPDGETGNTLALAGRHKVLKFTGTPGGACTVTIDPADLQKLYVVDNQADQNVIIYQGAGATVTILPTKIAMVYCDGAGAGAAVKLITTAVGASTGDGNYETTSALHIYGAGAANELVETFGLVTVGDGGGGKWYYNTSTDRADANLGTILDVTVAFTVAAQGSGTGTGCWVREYTGETNAAWWGAGTTISSDDALALQGALDHWIDQDNAHLIIPPIQLDCYSKLVCEFTMSTSTGHTISGFGAQLTDLTTATDIFWQFKVADGVLLRNIKLQGFTIRGSNDNTTHLIQFLGDIPGGSADFLYRVHVNDVDLDNVRQVGFHLHGVFESTFNTCYIQHGSANFECILVENVGGGAISTSSLTFNDCICYGGKNGLHVNSPVSDVHVFGGTYLKNNEYGIHIENAYNRSMIGVHLENCWESAPDLASGDAGIYMQGRGTVINCTGTTNNNMKHVVRFWILDNRECTIIGGAVGGDVEEYAVVSGAVTSGQVNVIGGEAVFIEGGNATVVRL